MKSIGWPKDIIRLLCKVCSLLILALLLSLLLTSPFYAGITTERVGGTLSRFAEESSPNKSSSLVLV
jgi:hypothetical protein